MHHYKAWFIITTRQRICVKVTFLSSATKLRRLYFHRCVSVHRRGAWSGGVSAPGGGVLVLGGGGSVGCLVPGVSGPGVPGPRDVYVWSGRCVCSWGVPGPWWLVSQHALRETPQERLLLLRTVHILLECILVSHVSVILPGGGSYYLWCTGGNPLKPSPPHGSHFSGLTKFLTLP